MANRSRSRSKDRRDRHRDARARSGSRSPARREPSRQDTSHDRHRADDRHKESRRDNRDRDRDRNRDRNRDDRSRYPSDSGSRRRRDSDSEDDRGRDRDHKKKSRKDDEPGRKPRETSEERAARKALRKKEKEEQKKSIEIAMTNYSNSDNPFNDANLAQKFTWAKKREVEKKKGISSAESARRDIIRREEAKIELEKLNKKRAEREREREEREEEMLRIQRASEQAQLGDWQAQEEEFHLKQAKRRAEIRIKSNRAKPIDILAMNIKLISDSREEDEEEEEDDIGLEIDVDEPYAIFDVSSSNVLLRVDSVRIVRKLTILFFNTSLIIESRL